jgi:hypothetical protein
MSIIFWGAKNPDLDHVTKQKSDRTILLANKYCVTCKNQTDNERNKEKKY